jgi:acyl carrier protein
VTDQPAAPPQGELRRFLQARLPDYMMPALFVWLAELPHAPNGKVDYRALPAAATLRPASEAAYVAPASDIERGIARLWQEVLRVEKVGLHDNFFDLGGHSLAMVQVHGKLQSLYSYELSLVDMFRYPTISALVSYVNQQTPQPWSAGTGDERAATRRQAIARQRQRRQEQRHTAPRAKGSA